MIKFYSWISNISLHISFIINSIQNSSKKNSKNLKILYTFNKVYVIVAQFVMPHSMVRVFRKGRQQKQTQLEKYVSEVSVVKL